MSAPRVLHVVESLGIGGIERIVEMLARHHRGSFRIEVLCTSRGGPIAEALREGGTPVRVLDVGSYYPSGIAQVARVFRTSRPDVVHGHGHFAGVLARGAALWAGVGVVVHHLHTIDTTLRRRHRELERLLGGLTSAVICCSGAVESHARRDLRLPSALLRTIPNGIDPAPEVPRARAREALGRPRSPVIGCVGGLAPHKGQAVLLRALPPLADRVKRGTVIFVGDGVERDALERKARRAPAGWSVRFLGARPDARALLPAFDLAVIPSIEREGFGLAALEAMDAGIPVVASAVGGLPEIVESGVTGLLVPPSDPEALAGAIASVWADGGRGRALGASGRARVESRFRGASMASRIATVYEEALRERPAA